MDVSSGVVQEIILILFTSWSPYPLIRNFWASGFRGLSACGFSEMGGDACIWDEGVSEE
jgi:hypothetical protein